MSRSILMRPRTLVLVLGLALTSPVYGQSAPPTLRLDDSGVMPEPGSTPCNMGIRATPGTVQHESSRPGATIDACGRLILTPGSTLSMLSPPLLDPSGMANARIDSMVVYATTFGYYDGYSPGGSFQLTAHAEVYYLDNGTSWQSGAGSHYRTRATFDHVEASGDTFRYVLNPPSDGVLYRQTDFNSGEHSAQGEIAVEGSLVLVAIAGSSEGMLLGHGRITSNDATWYGEPRFNYYQAPVGSIVPFRMRYRLYGTVFSLNLFSTSFSYNGTGAVDFVHAARPPLVALEVKGPPRIPDQSTHDYHAIARYEGGTLVDVTEQATWSVAPAGVATISGGSLTVGPLVEPQTLTVRASYNEGGVEVADEAEVVARHDFYASDHTTWPMYQNDSRHTGFLPVTPSLSRFRLLWQRNLGVPLNPVTGGDGRVFCTGVTYFSSNSPLVALDAATGVTLWSWNFGPVFSVNPPSHAYGNVYVQSGNHGSDTWLHAFDARTGERVFFSPHSAQWERYFAPTIQDGKVYLNGGYYGGMYAFDALTGAQLWFGGLPQYDQWTPAIDQDYAYAYVGSYSPGLYALRRSDGQQSFMIPDPQFEWNGWSMDLAPVVGAHDDVLAIHDDRLISFDVVQRRIRWQLARAFRGQPSIANDVIYAIDGGALVALNEVTGATIWSWTPPSGVLQGALVVTASLAFVTSATHVYAVSLDGRADVWSHPVSGHLAIANGALYVASASGVLSAFDVGIGPPLVAHAGTDITLECAAALGGTHATLDGSASEGPDLSFEWTATDVTFDDPHALTPTGTFPLGVHAVVLTVSRDGSVDRDTVVVTVQDTSVPALALAFEPPIIWPPNHELVHVHVVARPSDACDAAPAFRLLSVTSSDPDGDPGDVFSPDILDASYGQADVDVWLRAQREPGEPGRAYTLCYEVEDATGHAVTQCASLSVARSRGRAQLVVEGSPRLTIYGSAETPAESIDPATIAVSTDTRDVWRAVVSSVIESDIDGDGLVDRTWSLEPVEGSLDLSTLTEAALYARWRAGSDEFFTIVQDAGVADVGPRASALRIDLASNPARGQALLAYELPEAGRVRLTLYDIAGRTVARLVDGHHAAGRHEARFAPAGHVSSTLLFYRLEWEGQRLGGSFVLLR